MTETDSAPTPVAAVPFPRNRWQAGLLHLGVSALIGLGIYLIIRLVWYPQVLFSIGGGLDLAILIIVCDVVIGPLLTTLVFKRGKRTLKFDLSVIVLLQAIAFGYGAWVIFMSRPAFMVGETDRIYALGYNQIDPKDLADAPHIRANWLQPAWFCVHPVKDPMLVDQFLSNEFAQGKDLPAVPRFYRPFSECQSTLLKNAKKNREGAPYVPIIARHDVGMAFLDDTGNVKQMQAGDPWAEEATKPD